mmetsp:Transcript_16760/g.30776  ORF Transcript_16760/g.30776 Transcript_16760/m.30776 type:complete len:374 (-) Transcript_16760:134-1255(-)
MKRWALLVIAIAMACASIFSGSKVPGSESMTLSLWKGYWIARRQAAPLQEYTTEIYAAAELPFKGKRAIVTGATKGLGRGIAVHLSALGFDLVLPCRKVPEGLQESIHEEALKYRNEWNGPAVSKDALGTVETVVMDLSDLDAVDAAVQELQGKGATFDLLINNAGLQAPAFAVTKQGFETTVAVNFLGTARFTLGLLEAGLLKTNDGAKPRVITVTSEAHREARALDSVPIGQPWGSGLTDLLSRYSYSKLLLVTWCTELGRRYDNILAYDMCPGGVASEITKNSGVLGEVAYMFTSLAFTKPKIAALPFIRLATASEYNNESVHGTHLHQGEFRERRPDAEDPANGAKVWEAAQELFKNGPPQKDEATASE